MAISLTARTCEIASVAALPRNDRSEVSSEGHRAGSWEGFWVSSERHAHDGNMNTVTTQASFPPYRKPKNALPEGTP